MEVVDDEELVELDVPNEGVRLDNATEEELYPCSDEESGKGRLTESGFPSVSL